MIDLHCHSIYSDGRLTPEELILKAQNNQIKVLALTDHDTIQGHTEFFEAAQDSSVTAIRGIELSVRWKKHDIHILGYNFSPSSVIQNIITAQQNSRIERAREIGNILERFGIENAYSKACEIAGHTRVGRPHYAQLLIQEGKAKTMELAFRQLLGRGKPAYVPTQWIHVTDAVAGLSECGGMAVIAHPFKYGLTRSKLHELIKEFKEAGGVGIEVVSGCMNPSQIMDMAGISLRFELRASSGSDYHGDMHSHVSLGRQAQLPEQCLPLWHDWNI